MNKQGKVNLINSINDRISELRREIQVLSTEERQLFFAAKPVELMIAMSRMIDLRKELASLEKQANQLSVEIKEAM